MSTQPTVLPLEAITGRIVVVRSQRSVNAPAAARVPTSAKAATALSKATNQ